MEDLMLVKLSGMQRLGDISTDQAAWEDVSRVATTMPRYNPSELHHCTFGVQPNYRPFEYDDSFRMSFDEVADSRAEELIALAIDTDKRILVSYSGGIDSTMALIAILKNIPWEERDRLAVVMTSESILENVMMYELVVRNIPAIPYYSLNEDMFLDSIVITGIGGGVIFGHEYIITTGIHTTPVMGNWDLTRSIVGSEDFDRKVEMMQVEMKQAPMDITTIWDLFSWIFFNYQYVNEYLQRLLAFPCLKRLGIRHAISPKLRNVMHKQIHAFFDSHHFDQWSIRSFSVPPSSLRDHKGPGKKYISSYIQRNYESRKIGSGALFVKLPYMEYAAIDSKFNIYNHYDTDLRLAIQRWRQMEITS